MLHQRPELIPPVPSPEDAARWEHTSLRQRLMMGMWRADLEQAIQEHIGRVRRGAWGKPDLSSNVAKSISVQLAVLYNMWPTVSHPSESEGTFLGPKGALATSGIWSLMQRVQAYTIACREFIVRLDASESGVIRTRPVWPNNVHARSLAADPMRPVVLEEARLLDHPETGEPEWVWECFDISDPEKPVWKYERRTHDRAVEDVSALYIDGGRQEGAAYQYRYADGRPFIPAVMYHAALTGQLWDAFEGVEVIEGSVNASVGWSFWFHCLRDASWPQRYAVGADVPGANTVDEEAGRRRELVTDPTSLLMLESAGEGQAIVGQFQPGADVGDLADALAKFEARVAEFAGVSPADIQRLGGQARSGYAISINRAGQRAAAAKMEPIYRLSDLELIGKAAALLNRATGSRLPESDYSISYAGVPKSAEEAKAERDHIESMMDRGLMSPVDALMYLHPDWSRSHATAELDRIRRERLAYGA